MCSSRYRRSGNTTNNTMEEGTYPGFNALPVVQNGFGIAACAVVLCTLPVYILFIRMLWKLRAHKFFRSGFFRLVLHHCICGLITGIIKIFIDVPSNISFIRLFLNDHSWIDRVFGILVRYKIHMLGIISVHFSALMGLNRCTAVLWPEAYDRIWSAKSVSWICILVWTFYTTTAIPFIWPLTIISMKPFSSASIYIYAFIPEQDKYQVYYSMESIIASAIPVLITYICYIIIAVKLLIYNVIGNATLKSSIKRGTIAAAVGSIGALFACAVAFSQEIVWLVSETNFLHIDFYTTLFNLGFDFNTVILPWSLIAVLPDMRKPLLRGIDSQSFFKSRVE